MASVEFVTLEVADTAAAERFYASALDTDKYLRLEASDAATSGFRGFTMSLIVSQSGNADAVIDAFLKAGATSLKPAKKSLWGYGGVVQAPDGTVWTVASQSKKDSGPVSREIDETVLQLGVEDVAASKQFYVDHGFEVAKSYGRKYVEFATSPGSVKLSLYKRRGLAKVAGVDAEGSGSHRIQIGSDAGPFTDPDGFVWASAK
ncbi:glyoxalase [Actinomadura sp. 7K534]|uniref:glyoxalase n=1 Tax=Actinomadura sp. 7K534 TaxID=2530366 RepID=UPI00104C9FB5|nr:glyoxalase [Actinomadura sp. 7K534]TDB97357.1 glyoxalase [Actinomadura sp. 7K534]